MLTAVLVDVGGTLWPDRSLPDEPRIRRDQMRSACGEVGGAQVEALIESLQGQALEWDATSALVQETDKVVKEALAHFELGDLDPLKVRRAMCVPATPGILYEGAAALLKSIKNLGLRCVILSNTGWRDSSITSPTSRRWLLPAASMEWSPLSTLTSGNPIKRSSGSRCTLRGQKREPR